ncbi:hypothetical protein [Thalassiella azotivora]
MRRVLAVGTAVLGLVALGAGIGLRTVWLPDDQVSASATLSEPGPLVHTAPGLLEARPGPVTVTAERSDGGPVLLALGREADVLAYADGVRTTVLDGFDAEQPSRLTTTTREAAEAPPALTGPAGSDLWVRTETGTGSATLDYDPGEGRWLVLAAGDGTSPAPGTVTLTWPREVSTPWATPLVALGALLLLGAAGLLLWPRLRSAGSGTGRRGTGAPVVVTDLDPDDGWDAWEDADADQDADDHDAAYADHDAADDDAADHDAADHDAGHHDGGRTVRFDTWPGRPRPETADEEDGRDR